MSSEQAAPDGAWSGTLVQYIIYLSSLFTAIGTAIALPITGFGLAIVVALQLGPGGSTLYLLYKIAQELHHLRIIS
jgi:hypothetical protein